MRKHNITPNEITLSTIMSAAPSAEAAVLLMESFLKDFPDAVNRHPGCFNALLTRLRDERDYVNVGHWWQAMRKRKIAPNDVTLAIMISAAPTAEDAARLQELLFRDDPGAVRGGSRTPPQASETTTSDPVDSSSCDDEFMK